MRPYAPGREITPGSVVVEHLNRSNGFDVYDAFNEPRACRVIVKTLRPDRVRHAPARRGLLREGRLLLRLTHPHIVRAYEVHGGERPAVVTETLTGETVGHMVETARRSLSAAELANLGSHLASALHHLHAHGILHLDLKPGNVIAEAGRAKVIDLSHARAPGRMKRGNGTWCYMSPEQARGGAIDAAADVWGLGIVLHAAATQTTALADIADDLDVDDPQLHARPPSVATARPRLDRALTTLVDSCLEADPTHRPTLAEASQRLLALT